MLSIFQLRSSGFRFASLPHLRRSALAFQPSPRLTGRSSASYDAVNSLARFSSHCPWVWNCVGANNHRQFVLFVITLVLGIISFDYLTVAYFSTPAPAPSRTSAEPPLLSTSPPAPSEDDAAAACLLPDPLCSAVRRDAFLFSVAAWSTLQLTWTIVLLASQLWQIARQMTTLEVSNLGRYGFMGGRGSSMAGQQGHQHLGNDAGDEISAAHSHAHGHKKATGFLLSVLGFDRFTKGKAADGLKKAAHAPNPFDLGWIGNCKDFWTKGKELGVEYEALYDVPPEGFREAKRRRAREEADDGFSTSGHKRNSGVFARTMMMGRNLTGLGGRSRGYGGYEPVNSGAGDV